MTGKEEALIEIEWYWLKPQNTAPPDVWRLILARENMAAMTYIDPLALIEEEK